MIRGFPIENILKFFEFFSKNPLTNPAGYGIIYTERTKKGEKRAMEKAIEIIKELTKLIAQLDKLLIKIISAVGWVLILIEVLD